MLSTHNIPITEPAGARGASLVKWLIAFAAALLVFVGLLAAAIIGFMRAADTPVPVVHDVLVFKSSCVVGTNAVRIRNVLDPVATNGVWRPRLKLVIINLPPDAQILSCGEDGMQVTLPSRQIQDVTRATDDALRWGEKRSYRVVLLTGSESIILEEILLPQLDRAVALLPSHPGAKAWLALKEKIGPEASAAETEPWRKICADDPFAPAPLATGTSEPAIPEVSQAMTGVELAALCAGNPTADQLERLNAEGRKRITDLSQKPIGNDVQAQAVGVFLNTPPAVFAEARDHLGQQAWDYADRRMRFFLTPRKTNPHETLSVLETFAARQAVPDAAVWKKRWKAFLDATTKRNPAPDIARLPPAHYSAVPSSVAQPLTAETLKQGLAALAALETAFEKNRFEEHDVLDENGFVETWRRFLEGDRFMAQVSFRRESNAPIPVVTFTVAPKYGAAGLVERQGSNYVVRGTLRWGDTIEITVTNTLGQSVVHSLEIAPAGWDLKADVYFWNLADIVGNYAAWRPHLNDELTRRLENEIVRKFKEFSVSSLAGANPEAARFVTAATRDIPALAPELSNLVTKAVNDVTTSRMESWAQFCEWRRRCLENGWKQEFFEGFPPDDLDLRGYIAEIEKPYFRVSRVKRWLETEAMRKVNAADFNEARACVSAEGMPPEFIELAWERCLETIGQSAEKDMEKMAGQLWAEYDKVFTRCYLAPDANQEVLPLLISGYDDLKNIRKHNDSFWDPTYESLGLEIFGMGKAKIKIAGRPVDIEKTLAKWGASNPAM